MGGNTFMVLHQTIGPHCNRQNKVNEGFSPIVARYKRSISKLSTYPVTPCPENTFSNRESEPTDSLILHSDHCAISLYHIAVSKLLPEPDIFNPERVFRIEFSAAEKLVE
jgi:hypothetical protein